ncbi:MAG: LON peptidase substrate-binding domain-containing protein [Chloroflexi bacterium]|nr:LON peptidase substrate-binding domain-containing protein [Chloroflexota bacterium]
MMHEIPLFPLNTVLFPGMLLRLHIFEERYRVMIARCRQTGEPFGVALIQEGQEVGGPAEPHLVGCTAYITQVETLADGRMNITVVGHERFQIHALKHDQPYLVGLIEGYPLAKPISEGVEDISQALRAWVRRYLQVLSQASETPLDMQELPSDWQKLAYLASFLIQLPPAQKQDLLVINRAEELLNRLRTLYRREVTLLQTMLVPHEEESIGPFSAN